MYAAAGTDSEYVLIGKNTIMKNKIGSARKNIVFKINSHSDYVQRMDQTRK